MKRTIGYTLSAKMARKNIDAIVEKATKMSEIIGEKASNIIAQKLKETMIALLQRRSSPKDANSESQIQNICNGIRIAKTAREISHHQDALSYKTSINKYVFIPRGENGLTWFLEYGTGLEGQKNPHPKSQNYGWKYAINDNTERIVGRGKHTHNVHWYPTINGKKGFVFKQKNNSYIDINDIYFENIVEKKAFKAKIELQKAKTFTYGTGRMKNVIFVQTFKNENRRPYYRTKRRSRFKSVYRKGRGI